MFLPRRRNRRRIAVTERSFADLLSTFFESDETRDRSLLERVSVIKIDARKTLTKSVLASITTPFAD